MIKNILPAIQAPYNSTRARDFATHFGSHLATFIAGPHELAQAAPGTILTGARGAGFRTTVMAQLMKPCSSSKAPSPLPWTIKNPSHARRLRQHSPGTRTAMNSLTTAADSRRGPSAETPPTHMSGSESPTRARSIPKAMSHQLEFT